jgi:putative component of toxin-antitoxin plasmid stabilization module
LLDLSGRRVRHLEPGANDVRGLRAGVYFLRERTGPAVRVIVTQ